MGDFGGISGAVRFVTDFGDQAVLLPLFAGVAAMMVARRWFRGALAWGAAVAGTLVAVFVLKLALLSCGRCWPGAGLQSPSGHTAAAAAMYGGLLSLWARRRLGDARWTAAIAVGVAVVFGASRLLLQVHSWAEVGLGGLVGVVGALAFVAGAGFPPGGVLDRRLLAVVGVILLVCHGFHVPAEAAIRSAALNLGLLCPCGG